MSDFFQANTALILQILSVVAIAGIGFFTFKIDPLHLTTKKLAIAAMLIVLSVVLQLFSLMVPLFGFPSFRIGFSQLPLMMIGVLLGPSWAVLSGIIQDFLGLIVTPTGYPFFGFTLNKVVIAFLPALLFSKKLKISSKHLNWIVQATLVLFFAGTIAYLWQTQSVFVSEGEVEISLMNKVVISLLSAAMMIGLMFMIHWISQKYQRYEHIVPIGLWALSVILVEIVVQLVLTPIWLVAMYGIPVWLSFLVRVVKAAVMVPVLIVIGYGILLLFGRMNLMSKRK